MKRSFRTSIILYSLGIILISVLLNSIFSSFILIKRYNTYMVSYQEREVDNLIGVLKDSYSEKGYWDSSILEEIKKFRLADDFNVTLIDGHNNVILTIYPENTMYKHQRMMGNETTKHEDIYIKDVFIGSISVTFAKYAGLGEEAYIFEKAIKTIIFFSGFIASIIVIFLALAFEKRISGPVQKITQAFNGLGKGRYDTNIQDDFKIVELNILKNSLNNLIDELKDQMEMRRRLSSDISHEIKTPMTIINGNIEAIDDGLLNYDEKTSRVIRSQLDKINQIVSQIQYLDDIKSSDISLDIKEFDLSELGKSAFESFLPICEAENIKLNVSFENVLIKGDWDKLTQVIYNLMTNSIKSIETDGEIIIGTKYIDEKPCIYVKDNGVGISKENQDKIFERFYRIDNSRNSKIGGSGIGLALAKEIVEMHSGKIFCESTLGQGSIFYIVLQ